MLRVEGLRAGYGDVNVLDDLDLTIDEGEFVVLLGANGAGKTTTLRAISGDCTRTAGSIVFEGTRIDRLGRHEIARLGIAHVPEGRRIFASLTVEENLVVACQTAQSRTARRTSLGEVHDLFPVLKERRRQQAGTLSGGEQQMLAIGRALMARPRVILLDEPSAGLSPRMYALVLDALAVLGQQGRTILLAEQADPAIKGRRGHILTISDGRIAAGSHERTGQHGAGTV